MTRYIRARRVEGSWPPARVPLPHPDAARPTRRIPFEQLRALVISLIEPEPEPRAAAEDPAAVQRGRERPPSSDDAVSEFDSLATTCRGPRTSTLDQLIAFLRKQ